MGHYYTPPLGILEKLAVVGSRDYAHLDRVEEVMYELFCSRTCNFMEFLVISGGARGVDNKAIEVANKFGCKSKVYPADWNTYGKSAGAIRNKEIVKNADFVVCFYDGQSKGTKITMDLCMKTGKPYIVINDFD